jgi:hypothetical protein
VLRIDASHSLGSTQNAPLHMQRVVLCCRLPWLPASNTHSSHAAVTPNTILQPPNLAPQHSTECLLQLGNLRAPHSHQPASSNRRAAAWFAAHLQAEVTRAVRVLAPSHGLCTLLQPNLRSARAHAGGRYIAAAYRQTTRIVCAVVYWQ